MSKSSSFLSKKSWHVSTIKNQKRVWELEQEKEAEQKKVEQWKREKEEQDEIRNLRNLAQGNKVERLDWMYEGGYSSLSSEKNIETVEDYLSGKKIDDSKDNDLNKTKSLPGALFNNNNNNNNQSSSSITSVQDMKTKFREDPLQLILQKQKESIDKLKSSASIQAKLGSSSHKDKDSDKILQKLKKKEKKEKKEKEKKEKKEKKDKDSTSKDRYNDSPERKERDDHYRDKINDKYYDRDQHHHRDKDYKDDHLNRDNRDTRDIRDNRDYRDYKDNHYHNRDNRDIRDTRDYRDYKDNHYHNRDNRDRRETYYNDRYRDGDHHDRKYDRNDRDDYYYRDRDHRDEKRYDRKRYREDEEEYQQHHNQKSQQKLSSGDDDLEKKLAEMKKDAQVLDNERLKRIKLDSEKDIEKEFTPKSHQDRGKTFFDDINKDVYNDSVSLEDRVSRNKFYLESSKSADY